MKRIESVGGAFGRYKSGINKKIFCIFNKFRMTVQNRGKQISNYIKLDNYANFFGLNSGSLYEICCNDFHFDKK